MLAVPQVMLRFPGPEIADPEHRILAVPQVMLRFLGPEVIDPEYRIVAVPNVMLRFPGPEIIADPLSRSTEIETSRKSWCDFRVRI